MAAADAPPPLVFSAREATVEAGGVYELPVITDPVEGSFLLYHYREHSGVGVRFTIHTSAGRELLDELQPEAKDQLLVTGASRCVLRWDNTASWLTPRTLSYSVRVVSAGRVHSSLLSRLLHAAEHGPLPLLRERASPPPLPRRGGEARRHAERRARPPQAKASVAATDRHGNTPLHLSALRGNAPTLSLLLEAGDELQPRNAEGATPLHLAAFSGHAGAVERLLAARAEPDLLDARHSAPLHLAAAAGHAAAIGRLLEARASPSLLNGKQASALHAAVCAGHVDAAALLLDAPPRAPSDGDEALLAAAVTHRRAAMLSLLLDRPALTAQQAAACLADAPASLLADALCESCARGAPRAALRVLDASASPDASAPDGTSALRAAARAGAAPLVALLLRRGARDAPAAAAASLLDEAVSLGHTHVVRSLVRHAPTSAPLALLAAAAAGHTGMLLQLLDGGAPVDAVDAASGGTALHAAAAAGHTAAAAAVLSRGCPLDRTDLSGRTAVQLAVDEGHRHTAVHLLEIATAEQMLPLCCTAQA
ncbi:hypothetical protein AB1Y20_002074 [Prymnesium parvum]|uniref:Uncharacterized protein n=1 Tax=Prymnesium parvum TaxID=97485 RepID=A0AB34J819_PRYPA